MKADPLTIAKVMFAVMGVIFILTVVTRNPFLMFYGVLGWSLSGALVGQAKDLTAKR